VREEEKSASKEKALVSLLQVVAVAVVVVERDEPVVVAGPRRKQSTGRSTGEGPSCLQLGVVQSSACREPSSAEAERDERHQSQARDGKTGARRERECSPRLLSISSRATS
jgi:hypothetical protein